VITGATRRWRGALLSADTWREMRDFKQALRAKSYDEIIDTQGLVRTALVARYALGRSHGYDADSIKERPAAWFYNRNHNVARAQHAIARNRSLTALALGYACAGAPDYGLDRARFVPANVSPYGILLHATARAEKEWPVANWRALAEVFGRSIDLVLPFGSANERLRGERIASGIARARVPEWQPIDAMARLIAGASFVVGVDTGLLHLASACGVPLVAIFSGSEPLLTGPIGGGPITVLEGNPVPVEAVAAAVDAIVKGLRAVIG
jgi:heptosyltransferase I